MKKTLVVIFAAVFAVQSYSQITVPEITSQHPHIYMTQADIDIMRQRVAQGEQPWAQSWQNIVAQAEADMSKPATPYTGLEVADFYDTCWIQSERALNLAIAYQINPKRQYALAALNALYQWADKTTATVPGLYDYEPIKDVYNIGTAMLIPRCTIQFVFVYDLMYNDFANVGFTPAMKQTVENWFALLAVRVREGIWVWDNNDYFSKQEYQNHLFAHKMGLIGFGYALHDDEMVQFAVDSDENPRDFVELIAGGIFMEGDEPCPREANYADVPPVQIGEIYDRYRHYTGPRKGLQYGMLTLSVASTCAQMLTNNGLDFFQYTAPTGENMELAFDFYSSFYWLKDTRVRGGMYANENDRIGLASDTRAVFELGHRHYPDNRKINAVLAVSNRTDMSSSIADGKMTLMCTPVFTHGLPLLSEPFSMPAGNWDMTSTTITEQEDKQKLSIADTGGSGSVIVLGKTEQYGGDNPLYLPTLQDAAGNKVLHFDGNDSAYCPNLRNNYGDFSINFKFTTDDITAEQTIIYVTSLFEIRILPNTEHTAASLMFVLYHAEGAEYAYSPQTIVAGTAYQVNAWRQYEIAAIYVDGQTDQFAYMPFDMIATDANLYLGTIYKFDRRFFKGSIDDLSIQSYRYDYVCGDWGYPACDINKDCYVDTNDFVLLAAQWLDCTNDLYENCQNATGE